MSARAPDYVAPVEGWRLWQVLVRGGEIRLASLFFDARWEPGEAMTATCLHRRRTFPRFWRTRATEHDAPLFDCSCGIHAARQRVTALAYVHPLLFRTQPGYVGHAIGTVSLWGEVAEHEEGWRASFAYPRQLVFVPSTRRAVVAPEAAASALLEYGVPVELGTVRPADRSGPDALPRLRGD